MRAKKLLKYEIITSFSFSLFSLTELTEFTSSFIQGLQDILSNRTAFGIKRMVEVDPKPFQYACQQIYPTVYSEEQSAKLCSLWQENVKDPHWHPFKIILVDGRKRVRT